MQRKNNKLILPHLVYGVFYMLELSYSIIFNWPSWVVATIIFSLVAYAGVVFLKGWQSGIARIFFAITVWLNVAIFSCCYGDIEPLLTVVMIFLVLLSSLDIVHIHYISIVSTVIILLLHEFVVCGGRGLDLQNFGFLFARFIPVFVLEYLELNQLKWRINQEKQMDRIIQDLKAAEQGKMDFMANVSHEIRTPLNTICGIGTVLMDSALPASAMENVYEINVAGRHLMTLVSDILDFTELENDTVEVVNEPYNFTSIMNDVVNMAQAWNEQKKLDIIVDCDAKIPNALMGDGQKIYRIMLNLVNNAIKFTSEGGILISVSSRKEKYGVNLAIDIEDTGIGIKEENIERLNAVYNQVDTKRDRKEGGVGLGLAIARKMVFKMKGFIYIESTYGEGTHVSVVIPQKCVSEEPIASVNNVSNKHILYYIDLVKYGNGKVRDAYLQCIRNIASGLGLDCMRCNNMHELKHHVEKGNYNYVFTATYEYRQEKEYFDSLLPDKKVVIIADADSDVSDISESIKVIRKPFHVFSVAAILNGLELAVSDSNIIVKKDKFFATDAKVLAVDDVLMNLKVVAALLRRYGIKIDMAESGKEAIEKVQAKHYDLIFMDHMMPEMDGVETLHAIRSLSGKYPKTVPIVALTANAVGGAREMLLREGFDDFVAKPIEQSVMEHVLRKYLSGKISEDGEEKDEKVDTETTQLQTEKQDVSETLEKIPQETIRETTQEEADAGSDDLLNSLSHIEELNVENGMTFCGDDLENYVDILKTFIESWDDRTDKMKQSFEDEDMESYGIHVHSLKGMAATIGASELSEISKQLQFAANENRLDEIKEKHPTMLSMLDSLMSQLKSVLGVGEKDGAWSELSNAIEQFDQVRASEILQEMKNSDDADSLQVDKLIKCIEEFDFMTAASILEEMGGE